MVWLPVAMVSTSWRWQTAWQRSLRYYYYRLLRLRGTPQQMARGLAAGVFAGCFPFFGLQIAIGLVLATLVRGNRLLTVAGTWVSNPFTYVPIFAFNYQVGQWLLGRSTPIADFTGLTTWQHWRALGTEVATSLLLGSTVVAMVSSLLSYLIGLWLLQRLRSAQVRSRLRR